MKILYRIMYKNMLSVLLDRSLDRLTEQTSLEQPDSETQTDQIIFKILTQKLKSDEQQLSQVSLTLSEIKSKIIQADLNDSE